MEEAACEKATVIVLGMSGATLAELQFGIGLSVGKLKKELTPILAPDEWTADSTTVMLAYDGEEPDDGRSLQDMGIQASETVYFTGVVYNPHKLRMMDIERIHKEAVERSHAEAAEERRRRAEKKKKLIAERMQEVEAEFEETRQEEGPLLMLANEPASAPAAAKSSSAACPDAKVNEIVAAYKAFFDHISFRKGWTEPPFTLSEVASAFACAARIVALIRIEVLDVRDPGFKIRQVEGSARDWMHSPECGTLLRDDPNAFLEGLVHATFKDANGYVEGLTLGEVDELMKLYS